MPQSDKINLALAIAVGFLTYLVGAFGQFDGTYAVVLALFALSCLWLRHEVRIGRVIYIDVREPRNSRFAVTEETDDSAHSEVTKHLLAKLAEIPYGLDIVHSPAQAIAQRKGRSCRNYTWTHSTTVIAKTEAAILEFGAFVWHGGNWQWNPGKQPFTRQDFADWYSCPDGGLSAGQSYTDDCNWTGGDTLRWGKSLWYYIAVTPDGRLIKGQAVVELLPELSKSMPPEHECKDITEGGRYKLTYGVVFENPWGGPNYKSYAGQAAMSDGTPSSVMIEDKYNDTEYSDAFIPGASAEVVAAALDKLAFDLAFVSENIRQARAGLSPEMAVLWIFGDSSGTAGDPFLSFLKCFVEKAIRDGSHSTIRGVTNPRWFSEYLYFGKCPRNLRGTTVELPGRVWRYKYAAGAFEEVPVGIIVKPKDIHSVLAG